MLYYLLRQGVFAKIFKNCIIKEKGGQKMSILMGNGDWIANLIGDWSSDVTNPFTICLRVCLTIICSGIIGVERARKRHAAGFRTYMLVCLGAAIVMMVNDFLFQKSGSGDSARLGAQVISGIGFLGAGTILVTSRNQIKGLTTAAGLWSAACMGLAIGAGFYTLALIAVFAIWIILAVMSNMESALRRKTRFFELYVELGCRQNLKDLVNYLRQNDVRIDAIEKNPAYIDSGLSVYSIMLTTKEATVHDEFIEKISALDYVNFCDELSN